MKIPWKFCGFFISLCLLLGERVQFAEKRPPLPTKDGENCELTELKRHYLLAYAYSTNVTSQARLHLERAKQLLPERGPEAEIFRTRITALERRLDSSAGKDRRPRP